MVRENMEFLMQADPELGAAVQKEYERQRRNCCRIPHGCTSGTCNSRATR